MAATKDLAARRDLAERLIILRTRAGLSQREVAARIGINQPTLSHWEMGTSEPRILQALALADVYEVGLDVLTGRAPLGPAPPRPRRHRSDEADTECASSCNP